MFNYSDRKKIVLFFLPFIVLIYLYQDFPNLFCTISNKLTWIIHDTIFKLSTVL